jgi:translation initiation factor 4G
VKQFHQKLNVTEGAGAADKEQAEAEKKAEEDKKAEAEAAEKAAKEAAEKKAEEDQKAEAEAAEKAAKEEAEKAAKEKEEAEKAAKDKEAADKSAKEDAEKATKEKEDEAARLAAEEEERERMIAEMEAEFAAKEREEEEREREYEEKKAAEKALREAREAEEKAREDERLREQERAAEELEEKRAKGEQDTESLALFASLKKNTQFGPQAGATDSGASTPPAEPAAPAPSQPKAASAAKPRPANLKLETSKAVEPPQPSAAMLSLKSARFLQVRDELINYPDGFKSPNPALNMGSKKGRQYDKEFLLQFQDVFKEKPSTDWDQKLKETVGDSGESSARPQSARTHSMNSRQPSRGAVPAMGNFGFGGRTLPAGTTSEQRFQAATQGRPAQGGMANPLAHLVNPNNRTGSFPMARQGSFQNMSQGPSSPRVGSSRGGGRNSRRGEKGQPGEAQLAKTMPLTANLDPAALKLERSQTGWKPLSLSMASNATLPSGHMPPDMVQRKVKAALNKMTPEKFDRIADQIQEIAAQSKDENDGRTLRQVIQLTFEKACDEAHWASMYARFAERMLRTMSPEIRDETVVDKHGNPVVGGALFRKYLLNRCQEEFERGWEVNLPEKPEGQSGEAALLSDEYYIAAAAKRKGLGLIQFIGELYKLKMLTLRIMHECVLKLLDFEGLPDESAIESLVKLIRTVGSTSKFL